MFNIAYWYWLLYKFIDPTIADGRDYVNDILGKVWYGFTSTFKSDVLSY